jgi:acyl-CoA thioesterase
VTGNPSDRTAADVRARILDDPWARALGVEFLELGRGYCQAALRLAPHMINHQGTPHGGAIFLLADAAFSAACNSHGIPAVALSMTISYLSTATPGARLVAEARERRQGRRAGFYDVAVTDEEGRLVATVHCIAHRVEPES